MKQRVVALETLAESFQGRDHTLVLYVKLMLKNWTVIFRENACPLLQMYKILSVAEIIQLFDNRL